MPVKRPANFLYLLLGLLAILVGAPIAYEFTNHPIPMISQIAFSATLIISIWSLMEGKFWFIAGIVLVVGDLALTTYQIVSPSPITETITILLEMSFLSLSLVFALSHVLVGRRMDLNRIIGALCVYLLAGILLGQMNMLILRFIPESFNGIDVQLDALHGFDMIYYSFVTMTTLGYGDITPESPLARSVAYLGAITGQFYIAVLVAMVVGQFLSQAKEPKSSE